MIGLKPNAATSPTVRIIAEAWFVSRP